MNTSYLIQQGRPTFETHYPRSIVHMIMLLTFPRIGLKQGNAAFRLEGDFEQECRRTSPYTQNGLMVLTYGLWQEKDRGASDPRRFIPCALIRRNYVERDPKWKWFKV